MTPGDYPTVAALVFGAWQVVTPQTISQPVPEWEYQRAAFGSVQTKQVSAPLPPSCAVWEGQKIVGYRLNC